MGLESSSNGRMGAQNMWPSRIWRNHTLCRWPNMQYITVLQATQHLHGGSSMCWKSTTTSLESWSQIIGFERKSLASRSRSQCKRQRYLMRRMEIPFGGTPYANKWIKSGLILMFGRKIYQSCHQDIKRLHAIWYLMSRWEKTLEETRDFFCRGAQD